MCATAAAVIPFECQSDPETTRDCGAACLSMVYRSLGEEIPRDEIWPSIAKLNQFGSLASTTHLMTRDAQSRGFNAVAIQARHPLQALRVCHESEVRAILNFRPTEDAQAGHYAVLVDIDERTVILHDPFYGPARRVPHKELLGFWQPRGPSSEILGYVLIGISAQPLAAAPCWLCHAPMPPAVVCPRCKQPVGLRPGEVLGCINTDCIARMWNYICCPACDYVFSFSADDLSAAITAAQPASDHAETRGVSPDASPVDPLNLGRVFAEIDKFCQHILAVPGAADHPEIKKQLDFISNSKDKLTLAAAEALVHRKTHEERLAKMQQAAKANDEAYRKKLEELSRPSPPLDGNALGRALLENLGFTA